MKKITESNNVSHNQLIHEKSPYLLQHAYNPVNWYSWCDEAFDKAINEDKPIFLSIGYATCHWCHVMAHESFEDDEVAQLLNDNFISIKVDREERPDIDNVYMSVCQSLTGSGGWPLSVFMTPQSKPFYAGTYFPKSNRMGMEGFTDILTQISKLWRAERTRIIESADEITNFLAKRLRPDEKQVALDEGTLKDTYEQLLTNFDSRYGGFGRAPKFPTPHNLSFLLRWANRHNDSKSLEIVQKTLKSMRNGGIFDHIGFGFHRYSVDERWFAPHFEKMLYDQALLSIAYIEAFQKTGDELHAQTAHEIFTYVLRDMTFSEGGFFSAEDADSEGEEGKFYLWTQDEIYNHLGKDVGELFCRYFNITQKGNFEKGRNIPHSLIDDHTFAEKEGMDIQELKRTINHARQKLFEIRKTRVHPLKDDKILTAWNGLMIAALAKGYQVLGEQSYIDSATNAADFIVQYLTKHDGTLLRRYRDGDVAYSGYLNDYAFFVWGLIELYEATFNIAYLEEALKINHVMISNFWDNEDKGLFFSGTDNEKLIFSNKEIYDGAIPSGNSVAALNFLRLSRLTGDTNLDEKVDELIRRFSSQIKSHPMAYTHFMSALDFAVGPVVEIIIAGNPSDEILNRMIKKIRTPFLPNKVVLMNPDNQKNSRLVNLLPDIENMKSIESQPTVYLCEGYACKSPITSIEGLQIAIDQLTLKNN